MDGWGWVGAARDIVPDVNALNAMVLSMMNQGMDESI